MSIIPRRDRRVSTYQIRDVYTPAIAGRPLQVTTRIVEKVGILKKLLLFSNGQFLLRRKRLEEGPKFLPIPLKIYHDIELQKQSWQSSPDLNEICSSPLAPREAGSFTGISDYFQAYRNGKTSPIVIAEATLANIRASNQGPEPLNAIIAFHEEEMLKAAEESSKRYAQGRPLSILDGIPITVKGELRVSGLPSTAGTNFLRMAADTPEATIVSRLKQAGAIVVGIANMHEIGLGVTGANVHQGYARNPYNLKRHTGGSSSGSAVAVASGLVPLAIGTDGGGSVRIPSSLCGVVGLKTSFARFSGSGTFPSATTVTQSGPIASNALDCAIGYYFMAGADPLDEMSAIQPPPSLRNLTQIQDLSDLKVGIYSPWFEHADSEVVSICRSFLDLLKKRGLQVLEVEIPELEEVRVAHFNTIASEVCSAMHPYMRHNKSDLSLPNRVILAAASAISSHDYVQAQRMRNRAMKHLEKIFNEVDCIVSPTSAIAAPPIKEEYMATDVLDTLLMGKLMRFCQLHNLTGIPSISFPAGYTAQGLPVGIQFSGRWWAEADLLRIALAGDQLLKKKRPDTYYELKL